MNRHTWPWDWRDAAITWAFAIAFWVIAALQLA